MEDKKTIEPDPTNRPAGAWVLKEDGTLAPDLSDEAMRARYNEDGTKKTEADKEDSI